MELTAQASCHPWRVRGGLARPAGVAVGALVLYALVLRERQLRWGATDTETRTPLPGDDKVPRPDVVATRAITIGADVATVWPWVAQLGQGRGGFYSYDWLENLVGCQIHSADRIVPDWQHVAGGDDFRLHPDVALTVVDVDPPGSLVVQGAVAANGQAAAGLDAPYDFTWAFVLVPHGRQATRLIVRERYACHSIPSRALVEAVSVVSFVMTERMLRGVRDRAEREPPTR